MAKSETITLNNFSFVREGVALTLMFEGFTAQEKLEAAHALLCDIVDALEAEPAVSKKHCQRLGYALGSALSAIDAIDALESSMDDAAECVTPVTL